MARVISGKYEEIERLGQGGQGVVYKVRHAEQKTTFALKAIPAYLLSTPSTVGRFEQEALVLGRLRHRNIVQVLGNGRDETLGLIYIVMEYIQGKTLKDYLQDKGPLSLPEVLEISRQIADALAYAHAQSPSVIHRDIKPTNIMIEDFSGRVVLLDFGIAKELDDARESHTRTGFMIGTWKYSSPEQLRHEPLTGSADVYSLGMVMYEMYTGKQFFAGLEEPAVLSRVLNDEREHDPYFARPTMPEFVGLVKKAIAKSRDRRYRRMADLLNDLEACWWALDEEKTKTIFLNGPIAVKPFVPQPPPPANGPTKQGADESRGATSDHSASQLGVQDLDAIDAEIRRLQGERQRLAILSLQTTVREAREVAEQTGALQWAPVEFAQGRTQEDNANTHLRETQYALAQENFERALASFLHAREAATKAELRNRVEQVRREVETAKGDADRHEASTHASISYDRALSSLAAAETQFQQEAYEEARKLYAEARNQFEDARDLAYRETRREEACSAQTEASTAREAALREGADTLASTLVEEARRNEQQAAAALEREEFTQARALYLAASQKYGHAQRQAHIGGQTQGKVVHAAQAAEEAQKRVLAIGGDADAQPSYRQGLEAQRRATLYQESREYSKALEAYKHARHLFNETAKLLLATLQRTAETMQRRVETVRVNAESVHAQEKALIAYEHAQALEKRGNDLLVEQSYQQAIHCYEEAQRAFDEARESVVKEALREQVTFQQRQAQSAKKAAHEAQAEILAPDTFTRGTETEAQASAAADRGDFTAAQRLFEDAEQYYTRAENQARAERRQRWQRVMRSAQKALAAQEHVRSVDPSIENHPQYREAAELYERAQTHLADEQYEHAERLYQEVQLHYEALSRVIEEERLSQTVTQAREHMVRAREAAERAGANQDRTRRQWQYATNTATTAQEREQQGDLADAVTLYQEAEQQFITITQDIAEHTAHEAVRRRQRATDAKRKTESGRSLAEQAEVRVFSSELYRQALHEETKGEEALVGAKWEEAEAHFARAQEQFKVALEEAQRRKTAKDVAELAKRKAITTRDEAEKKRAAELFPERFREAVSLVFRAEQALQQSSFADAQREFTAGHQLFVQLHNDAKARGQQIKDAEDLTRIMLPPERDAQIEKKPPASERSSDEEPTRVRDATERKQDAEAKDATVVFPVPLPAQKTEDLVHLEGKRADVPSAYQIISDRVFRSDILRKYSVMAVGLLAVAAGVYLALRSSKDLTPRIIAETPRLEEQVVVEEGRKQTFTVTVQPAKSKRLRYEWYVGESKRETTSEPQWTYEPGYDESTETAKSITVVLREGEQERERRVWTNVVVQNQPQPPRLRRLSPAGEQPLKAAAGEELTFSVEVSDVDNDAGEPSWSVDGKLLGQGASQKIRIPAEGESHTVVAQVTDTAGGTDTLEWTITVQAPPQAAPMHPEIVEVTPAVEKQILVEEGRKQTFKVTVQPAKSKGLRYDWYIGESKRQTTSEPQWIYEPGYEEGTETTKSVTVVLREGEQERDRRVWTNVVVQNRPQPPKLQRVSPSGQTIEVNSGEELTFSVEVSDVDNDAEEPSWSVDGKPLGQGTSQKVRIPAEGESHTVVAQVTDKTGGIATTKWTVVVPSARSPQIVEARPKGTEIVTTGGQEIVFSVIVEPSLQGQGKANIQVEWDVDGVVRQSLESPQFRLLEERAGSHTVLATAINRDGVRSKPKKWLVKVRQAQGVKIELSKEEVRDWVERYRRAIEQKDSQALERLGLDKAEARQTIDDVKKSEEVSVKISMSDQDITLEGNPATEAKITFIRWDIRDGTRTAPGTVRYTVEKRANGQIMLAR